MSWGGALALDFSVNNAQHLNQVRTAQDIGASANVGNFMGMAAVEVEDPMSLLADAAEELTFSVDTTEDFELQERTERDRAISTRADRVYPAPSSAKPMVPRFECVPSAGGSGFPFS